jgi:hypothetical protein
VIETNDAISEWQAKSVPQAARLTLRVHSDGYVMWHREGCAFGVHEGGLQVGRVDNIPYETFLSSLAAEQAADAADPNYRDQRRVLFCGGCLVFLPR